MKIHFSLWLSRVRAECCLASQGADLPLTFVIVKGRPLATLSKIEITTF